jgi:GNAT superfamily N-acetyltransferase
VENPADPAAPRSFRVADGPWLVTRRIVPEDGVWLVRGLRRLSPQGNAYRFLHQRKRFTEDELHYLTHCDFQNHLALVMAVLGPDGAEVDGIGVARCIRDPDDSGLAEVAIVLVDEWQHRGTGRHLIRHLADFALARGISRWKGWIHDGNVAAERLFARLGPEYRRGRPGHGLNEIFLHLRPGDDHGPAGNARSGPENAVDSPKKTETPL